MEASAEIGENIFNSIAGDEAKTCYFLGRYFGPDLSRCRWFDGDGSSYRI
jgi:hypothetical protein